MVPSITIAPIATHINWRWNKLQALSVSAMLDAALADNTMTAPSAVRIDVAPNRARKTVVRRPTGRRGPRPSGVDRAVGCRRRAAPCWTFLLRGWVAVIGLPPQ